MSDKVFDKADLITFFEDEMGEKTRAGGFAVVHPKKDLLERQRTEHEVHAKTKAMFCEKHRFVVCVQTVTITNGGWGHLNSDHFLKGKPRLTLVQAHGLTSADLVRMALNMADEWRNEVGENVPENTVYLFDPFAVEEMADAAA
jgi:hypothetical protein